MKSQAPMRVSTTLSFYRNFSDGFCHFTAPLGSRRRFGPAPAEEMAPPQLAQPSPSAFPKPFGNDNSSQQRDESPAAPAGKPNP